MHKSFIALYPIIFLLFLCCYVVPELKNQDLEWLITRRWLQRDISLSFNVSANEWMIPISPENDEYFSISQLKEPYKWMEIIHFKANFMAWLSWENSRKHTCLFVCLYDFSTNDVQFN